MSLFIFLLLLAAPLAVESFTRSDFPAGFVFGSGTSAYQYEGAAFDYGRTPSIWDTFLHSGHSGYPAMGNGDVACDGYHKFKDDVKLMSDIGLEAFRFSISWSRLIPNGRGLVNPIGLKHYNDFIDELISHGIEPHVTLHHFDLPQVLEDEYGGWLSRKIVDDFSAYADVCFREFGDRVKYWTTLNEGNVFPVGGYSDGISPPGRCSPSERPGCVGNSSTEPYIVAHNILLAHSTVWMLYRDNYKETQKGGVGFSVLGLGINPWTNSEEDIDASQRAADFYFGWLLDPLVFGRYPESISKMAQGRIPVISESESKQFKGSFDFLGVNHYLTILVKDDPNIYNISSWNVEDDVGIAMTIVGLKDPITLRNGISAVHSAAGFSGLPVVPSGFRSMLEYLKNTYNNPPIYIQENGQLLPRDGNLNDPSRVEYLDAYMGAMLDSIRNGSNIKGYMTWTLLDCFELMGGYYFGYGFYYVDYDDELKRYKKFSAGWYSDFLKGKNSIGIITRNDSGSLTS